MAKKKMKYMILQQTLSKMMIRGMELPATEDEPEPHEPDTEAEGEPDLDVLRGHARRMQRVLAWHHNLLDMAQSRGEFDEVERIERDIDYVEGLLMHLPRP